MQSIDDITKQIIHEEINLHDDLNDNDVLAYFKENAFQKETTLSFYGNEGLAEIYSENENKRMRLNEPSAVDDVITTELKETPLNNADVCTSSDRFTMLDSMYPRDDGTLKSASSSCLVSIANTSKISENSSNCNNESAGKSIVEGCSEAYVISPLNPWYGSFPKEKRLDYLLRVPYLIQNGMNTGNVHMLKYLFIESLTEDCILELGRMTPTVGQEKVYSYHAALLNSYPDYLLVTYSIVKVRRRIYSFKQNGFTTCLPNIGIKDNTWNYFESVSEDKMDDEMKMNKQIYLRLKSQNKPMKLERKATVFMGLNNELDKIEKLVYSNFILEVFEIII